MGGGLLGAPEDVLAPHREALAPNPAAMGNAARGSPGAMWRPPHVRLQFRGPCPRHPQRRSRRQDAHGVFGADGAGGSLLPAAPGRASSVLVSGAGGPWYVPDMGAQGAAWPPGCQAPCRRSPPRPGPTAAQRRFLQPGVSLCCARGRAASGITLGVTGFQRTVRSFLSDGISLSSLCLPIIYLSIHRHLLPISSPWSLI